jgi:hypothetical protein
MGFDSGDGEPMMRVLGEGVRLSWIIVAVLIDKGRGLQIPFEHR